ncbi:MAG: 2,4-dihydroxyhept-2-ene-1,7-dioic acid aldolase [Gammaproteobacteria bacterium]|nr:2,4-dihydroxyhept-2-ene-1,7-dioic acid aldolase [Gammaproteobacteria bacterium]NNC66475.1 2,4-dihydroxyhept-2-ene-1,7-dioic acid aldolase [Gammaproteobacteria bacterium]
MFKSFRQRLQAGEILLSTLVSFPSPEIVELLSKLNFDWLFIDGEHGPFGTFEMQRMLQVAGNNCPCLIRVPSNDLVYIKQALDIGAAGIIVPQINNADETQAAVRAAKYPTLGNRGVGLARAHEYGISFTDYLANADSETCVVIQAETQGAIEHIDEIVAIKDVDAILIGPYDLSANLGYTGQIDHPEVVAAISKVEHACKQANVKLGYFGVNAETVLPYKEKGFTLLTIGVDSLFVLNSAQQLLDEMSA